MPKKIVGRNGGTLIVPEKGESANPNGRPPGTVSLKMLLKEIALIEHDLTKDEKYLTLIKKYPRFFKNPRKSATTMYAVQLCIKVMEGDLKAMKEFADRLEGAPSINIEADIIKKSPITPEIERQLEAFVNECIAAST
jgi:hypothetical protein